MKRVQSKKCSNEKSISIKQNDKNYTRPFRKSYSSQDNSFREDFKSNKLGKRYSAKDGNIPSHKSDNLIRLNRFISNAGVCSRRDADTLIQQGKIKVNGVVCSDLGTKVSPEDQVSYNSKTLYPEEKIYIAFNKPKDCITTSEDNKNRVIVMDYLRSACKERIYPIGRLDRDSTGVLIFTNDGDLAKGLSHPGFKIKKIYNISLDKPLKEADLRKIQSGITLHDGKVIIDKISIDEEDKTNIGIEIHSGKNRILRRLFKHIGYEVKRLDRTLFGDISKHKIARGKWRHLDQYEILSLKKMIKISK